MGLWTKILSAIFGKKKAKVPGETDRGNLYVVIGRPLLFLDFETTGVDPIRDRAIEVAGARHDRNGRKEFHYLINAGVSIPQAVSSLTGISDESISQAPQPSEIFARLEPILSDSPIIVAHNAIFDIAVLVTEQRRAGLTPWHGDFICTRSIATLAQVGTPSVNRAGRPYTSYKLSDVARALGLSLDGAHRAGNDISVAEEVFRRLYPMAVQRSLPILNTVVQPKWASTPEYMPNRAKIHITQD